MKITEEERAEGSGFSLDPIPWTKTGYFYKEEDQPARHPYYSAGLYYLQEPSAMTPAARFPVEPGERVLDLCAAPGGKSLHAACKLNGTGLVSARDLTQEKISLIEENAARSPYRNIEILVQDARELRTQDIGRADIAYVDAPCSGLGIMGKKM